jgi:hypothetical protein
MPCVGTAPCGPSINPIGSRRRETTKQGRKCRRLHTVSRNSIQRTFHCPGQADDSQIQQVHWKAIVMNLEGFGFGRVAAAWEGSLAQQCHKVVEDPDVRKVDLRSVGGAATCNAMLQQLDPKPVNFTARQFTNNDSQSRHCSRFAGAVCATKSKRAPAKFYSESAAQRQHKRKRRVNCQTEVLAYERTLKRNLAALPS